MAQLYFSAGKVELITLFIFELVLSYQTDLILYAIKITILRALGADAF